MWTYGPTSSQDCLQLSENKPSHTVTSEIQSHSLFASLPPPPSLPLPLPSSTPAPPPSTPHSLLPMSRILPLPRPLPPSPALKEASLHLPLPLLSQKRQTALQKIPKLENLSKFESLSDDLICRIFQLGGWNAQVVTSVACSSKRMAAGALANFWREFCFAKAPKMTSNLVSVSVSGLNLSRQGKGNGNGNGTGNRVWDGNGNGNGLAGRKEGRVIEGGWAAYSKLMRFCPGAHTSPQFEVKTIHHHVDRLGKIFSKSAGRRMLDKTCKRDTLYITETCDHLENDEEVGVFRGMVKKFASSSLRRQLEIRRVSFEEARRCPFCGMAVWSLAVANLVASGIMESLNCAEDEEGVPDCDIFVCLFGHIHGMCILADLDPDLEDDSKSGGSEGSLEREEELGKGTESAA